MMYQTTVFDVSLQSVFLARPNRTFGLGTSLGLHWQNMAIQACQVGWYFVCTHRDEVWTNGSKKTTKTMSLHMLPSGPGLTSIDCPFSSSVSKWLVLVAVSWTTAAGICLDLRNHPEHSGWNHDIPWVFWVHNQLVALPEVNCPAPRRPAAKSDDFKPPGCWRLSNWHLWQKKSAATIKKHQALCKHKQNKRIQHNPTIYKYMMLSSY